MPWKVLNIHDFFDLEKQGIYRYCETWCSNNSTSPHFEVFNSKKPPMKNGKTCKPREEPVMVRSLFRSFSLAENIKTSGVILTWNPPFGFMRFPFVIRWRLTRMKTHQPKFLCVYPSKVCLKRKPGFRILASSFQTGWKRSYPILPNLGSSILFRVPFCCRAKKSQHPMHFV